MHQSNSSDGYIKFTIHQNAETSAIPPELFEPLNYWREELWHRGLIGVNPDGIGYGNLSIRVPGTDTFFISGTATGGIPELEPFHYPLVERCEPEQNTLWCKGMVKASAESMSHYALYGADAKIGAVVHVHHRQLWKVLKELWPTTPVEAEYGTPEMAAAITHIAKQPLALERKVIVMGGHEEGLLSFGVTMEEAAGKMIDLLETFERGSKI